MTRLPRRCIAGFLFAVGVSMILVWVGLDILPALLQGKAPGLASHTTLPTHALDVGIIAPLAFAYAGRHSRVGSGGANVHNSDTVVPTSVIHNDH
jgi:hypothetical protein